MNLTLVIPSLAMGGGERMMVWLSSRLVEQGHTVSLIVFASAKTDFYECDSRVIVVRPHHFGLVVTRSLLGNKLRRAIRRLSPDWLRCIWALYIGLTVRSHAILSRSDIVVSFQSALNVAVMMGMFSSHIPVILSERSQPFIRKNLGFFGHRLRPWLYRRANTLVVLSQEVAALAKIHWGVSHTVVVPNASWLPSSKVPAMDTRPKVVLCLGRLHAIKSQLTLIEAWAKSAAAADGWILKIVGEGPLRPAIEAAIARLSLDASVVLHGASHDVMAHYHSASVFALSSEVEGFPNALLEAMASGCACVASDCSGAVKEMLAYGDAGLLFPVGDSNSLASALDRLTLDDSLRQDLGRAARSQSKLYSEDRVLSLWEEVLHSAGKSRDVPAPGRT